MNQTVTLQLATSTSAFERGVAAAISLLGQLGTTAAQTGTQISSYATNLNTRLTAAYSAADARQQTFRAGLGRLGSDLQSAGTKLSAFLTVPLLAAGAAAFKTYGDIDALKRGLAVIEGPAGNVNARFKELRQVAQLPGLGLEEAVKGDIRLRAVGISANLSKRALLEFGNAIALTGGGKSELDRVTTQLGQMSAKGKVLGNDLRPIIESATAAAPVIRQLFGTIDPEEISKKLAAVGQSSTDFIEAVTTGLSKLQRVSGGPKNAIENLSDAMKIASYEFVGAADKSLDLTGKLNSLGTFVNGLATSFSQMSPTAQTAILSLIGIAGALGPVTLAIGTLIKYGPILLSTFTAGFGGMKTAALALVSPIGLLAGAVAVVGALAYSIHQFNQVVDTSVNKSKLMVDVNKDVNASLAQETGNLTSLLAVAQNENISKNARQNAIKQINAISPEYLGGIRLETINTVQATLAIAKYTEALTIKAKIQILSQKQAEAQIKADDAASKSGADFAGGIADNAGAMFSSLRAFGSADAQATALLAKGNERRQNEITKNTNEAKHYQEELVKAQTEASKLGLNVPKVPTVNYNNVGGDSAIKKLKDQQKALADQIQSGNASGQDTTALQTQYDALTKRIDNATASTKKHKAAHEEVAKEVTSLDVLGNIYKRLGDEIQAFASKGQAAPAQLRASWAALGQEIEAGKNALKRIELPDLSKLTGKSTTSHALNVLFDVSEVNDAPKQLQAAVARLPAMRADFKVQSKFETDDQAAAFTGLKTEISTEIAQLNESIDFTDFFGTRARKQLADSATNMQDSLAPFRQAIAAAKATFAQAQADLKAGATNVFAGIFESIGAGKNPLQSALSGILSILGDYLIKQGAAMLLIAQATTLAAAVPGVGIAFAPTATGSYIAAAALIAGGGLVKGLSGSIPKFANGTVATGSTFGIFGEYPGARSNPELVSPVNLMAKTFRGELQNDAYRTSGRATENSRAVERVPYISTVTADMSGLHSNLQRYQNGLNDLNGN